MELLQQIEYAVNERVRPYLLRHHGDARIVSFDPMDGTLQLELFGACAGCPSANAETKHVLEQQLCAAIPEIRKVEIVQFTDQELVDFARDLLHRGKSSPSRAIKFCGGCNPKYERETIALKLEELFGHHLQQAKSGSHYDELYVICGCTARCADISQIQADRVIMIDSAASFESIKNSKLQIKRQGEQL